MTTGMLTTRGHVYVFLALVALTVTTVAAAGVDIGATSLVVALAIATGKALLVAWFFMHLRSSSYLIRATVVVAVAWLLILLGFTLSDVTTRGW